MAHGFRHVARKSIGRAEAGTRQRECLQEKHGEKMLLQEYFDVCGETRVPSGRLKRMLAVWASEQICVGAWGLIL